MAQQPHLIDYTEAELEEMAAFVAARKRDFDAAAIALARAKAQHKDAAGAYVRALDTWGEARFGDDWHGDTPPARNGQEGRANGSDGS